MLKIGFPIKCESIRSEAVYRGRARGVRALHMINAYTGLMCVRYFTLSFVILFFKSFYILYHFTFFIYLFAKHKIKNENRNLECIKKETTIRPNSRRPQITQHDNHAILGEVKDHICIQNSMPWDTFVDFFTL